MKVVVPGGTGQVGGLLRRALHERGDEVTVLSRRPERLDDGIRHVVWDGRTLGPWAAELDGADAVVNLAGRTVSCRYTDANLRQMMDSRVDSTGVVGAAIARAAQPPKVWLQMSTATIYADSRSRGDDQPHDEAHGSSAATNPTCRSTGSTACASRAGGRGHRPRPTCQTRVAWRCARPWS